MGIPTSGLGQFIYKKFYWVLNITYRVVCQFFVEIGLEVSLPRQTWISWLFFAVNILWHQFDKFLFVGIILLWNQFDKLSQSFGPSVTLNKEHELFVSSIQQWERKTNCPTQGFSTMVPRNSRGFANYNLCSRNLQWIVLFYTFRFRQMIIVVQEVPQLKKRLKTTGFTQDFFSLTVKGFFSSETLHL